MLFKIDAGRSAAGKMPGAHRTKSTPSIFEKAGVYKQGQLVCAAKVHETHSEFVFNPTISIAGLIKTISPEDKEPYVSIPTPVVLR